MRVTPRSDAFLDKKQAGPPLFSITRGIAECRRLVWQESDARRAKSAKISFDPSVVEKGAATFNDERYHRYQDDKGPPSEEIYVKILFESERAVGTRVPDGVCSDVELHSNTFSVRKIERHNHDEYLVKGWGEFTCSGNRIF